MDVGVGGKGENLYTTPPHTKATAKKVVDTTPTIRPVAVEETWDGVGERAAMAVEEFPTGPIAVGEMGGAMEEEIAGTMTCPVGAHREDSIATSHTFLLHPDAPMNIAHTPTHCPALTQSRKW